MEPDVRHIAKTDYSKHRVVRSDGEVTIDGVYPERAPGFYMVRVRVPGGVVTIAQAKALAEFAYAYANGEWHVDTRANVEFHGVSEAKLLPFIEALEPVGLTTRGACGDSVRNIVTGSETASASIERIQAVVDKLTRMFAGKPEFETLPRKFKIAFYAADDREPLHRINDLGFVEEAQGFWHNSGELPPELSQTLFTVWIGGGLGREPRLGDLLFAHVPEKEVPGLVAAAVNVHNEQSNRKNRARARLKFVLEELGLQRVRNLILEKWVPPAAVDTAPRLGGRTPPSRFAPSGIHVQDNGLFRVRVPVVAGDLTGQQARAIADVAEAAGAKQLVLSVRQNLSIPDIAPAEVPGLTRALEALGFPPSGWFGARDIVACPGSTSCRKGFVETHDFAQVLSNALESTQAPAWAKRLRISVSGCPNSCSQPQLYDIGFRGNAGKVGSAVVKGYDLLIGGRLYGRTLLAQHFANLLSQEDVVATATAAVRAYAELANVDEPFDALIDRVGLGVFGRHLRTAVPLSQGEWIAVPAVDAPTDDASTEAASGVLETRSPREILQWALVTYGDSLLVTSALGAGGVLLAQYLRELAPQHPSFLIDTGKLFGETETYYRQLREQFGLNLIAIGSGLEEREFSEVYGDKLWERDPNLCCQIRKVQVLGRLRNGKRAWVAGVRREQGGERAAASVLEREFGGVVKVQPLAFVTREWIDEQLRSYGIPQHPLHGQGYRSIGCEPCTRAVGNNESERDGRWPGLNKTECGLHRGVGILPASDVGVSPALAVNQGVSHVE